MKKDKLMSSLEETKAELDLLEKEILTLMDRITGMLHLMDEQDRQAEEMTEKRND